MVPQLDSPSEVVQIAGAPAVTTGAMAVGVAVATWYQELNVLVLRMRSVSVYVVVYTAYPPFVAAPTAEQYAMLAVLV